MKRTPARPLEYFEGYRIGHADGYLHRVAECPWNTSPAFVDGYQRGYAAGRVTRDDVMTFWDQVTAKRSVDHHDKP